MKKSEKTTANSEGQLCQGRTEGWTGVNSFIRLPIKAGIQNGKEMTAFCT